MIDKNEKTLNFARKQVEQQRLFNDGIQLPSSEETDPVKQQLAQEGWKVIKETEHGVIANKGSKPSYLARLGDKYELCSTRLVIYLPESVDRITRIQCAMSGKSLSQFVTDMLIEHLKIEQP